MHAVDILNALTSPWALVVGFFVLLAASIAAGLVLRRRMEQTASALATLPAHMTGFTYSPYPPPGLLSGRFDGRAVEIAVREVWHDQRDQLCTQVMTFWGTALGANLQVVKDFDGSTVEKLFGRTDLECGDPAFDAIFYIMGDDEARIAAFLDPTVRDGVIAADLAYKGVQLLDNCVAHDLPGTVTDEPTLRRVLEAQAPLAALAAQRLEAMSRPRPQTAGKPREIASR